MNDLLPLNNKKDAFNCLCGSFLLFMPLTGFHNISFSLVMRSPGMFRKQEKNKNITNGVI